MAQQNPFDQFDEPAGGVIVRDPYKASAERRDEQRAQRDAVELQLRIDAAKRDAANQDKAPAGYRWNADHTAMEIVPGGPAETGARNARLTPAERTKAIAGYKTAQQLRSIIKDIQALDASGPGSTHGLAGLRDYLPLTANQRLDAAGNAARGIVGQALGFTGGQLNTAQEAAMAVGPYLPQSSDRDEVRADKIRRLQELADTAEQRSIASLGGRPDDSGNIIPVDQPRKSAIMPGGLPPLPPSNLGPGTPDPVVDPSGNRQFSTEVDKAFAAAAQAAFNKGASKEEMQALARKYGAMPFGPDLDAAIAHRGKGAPAQFTTPVSGREGAGLTGQVLGGMAGGPVGSYFINAGNALSAGGLDEIAGWMGGNPQVAQVAKDVSVRDNPYSSLAGGITGSALAMLGINRVLGAAPKVGDALANGFGGLGSDALYGSLFGAGENNDNRLMGALTGAGSSAAGNVIGRGMFGGLGRAVRGVSNPSINYLRQRGVPLTLGQMVSQSGIAGRAIKGVEDKLDSIPWLGDGIRARRQEGYTAPVAQG